ncbi:MAG: hypothetical protein ACREPL_12215 [Rhodanobacteraceae bacterium]
MADKLGYAGAIQVLHLAQEQLGREINPILFSRAELAKRIRSDNAFVKRVPEQPKIWLIGNQDDLRA